VSSGSNYLQDLFSGVLDIAGDYVRSGIRVSVKTNLGPEIPIYSGGLQGADGSGSGGGGLGGLLGIKAAVVVRDASGNTISTIGQVPATDPVRAILAALVLAGLVFVIYRGVTR
jgi:hypothetical protein